MKETTVSDAVFYLLIGLDLMGVFAGLSTMAIGVREYDTLLIYGSVVFSALSGTSLINKIVETLRR